MIKQALINHIAILLDASSSMSLRRAKTAAVANNIIKFLAKKSEELDQETRATVYTFGDTVECVYYDKDVLRFSSVHDYYIPRGLTKLIGATLQAVRDLEKTATLYGDHAFVVYVLTDGQENNSHPDDLRNAPSILKNLPDNWSMAVLVPDKDGSLLAEQFGFPRGNIAIWDVNNLDGVSMAGKRVEDATNTFMENRAKGIRGTRSLFENVNVNRLVAPTTDKYMFLDVSHPIPIKQFCIDVMGFYQIGSAFYQLVKQEEVQPQKKVAILDKSSGLVYTGEDARTMLGLPNTKTVVHPEAHPKYDLFIQSTSVNRKLVGGTKVLVMNV